MWIGTTYVRTVRGYPSISQQNIIYFVYLMERKKKHMPGLREALLLRIPEKTSNLVIRLVDPLRVVALSAHDAISLHHPPPCKECCHYEWKTKSPAIMDAIWRLDPLALPMTTTKPNELAPLIPWSLLCHLWFR